MGLFSIYREIRKFGVVHVAMIEVFKLGCYTRSRELLEFTLKFVERESKAFLYY